jgi:hypothetical protein
VIPGLCEVTVPPLLEVEPGHMMACHIPLEELRRLQRKDPPPVVPVVDGEAPTTAPPN